MSSYSIIHKPGEGEYVDKKSRFIGHAMPISSEAEALALIDQVKRKYWDARHNCYAFITGENGSIMRFSDDGEPGGTAGRPILDVLVGANLHDALIVVTRYFGGTLLGTGGLVRAYTAASQEALAAADIRTLELANLIHIRTDYNSIGKLQYYLGQAGIEIKESSYTDAVEITITVKESDTVRVLDDITESTNGKSEISIIDTGYFSV